MIIGFHGTIGSGKDESFRQLKSLGIDCIRMSFGEEMKRMAMDHWGFTREDVDTKPPHVREVLQNLGQLFRKEFGKDFWINRLCEEIERNGNVGRVDSDDSHIIITDVRDKQEVDFIKNERGVYILIKRDDDKKSVVRKNYESKHINHVTETELSNHPADYYIENNGTVEDLRDTLEELINKIEHRGRH